MKYWINTVSRDHVHNGIAGGFTQANHGRPHGLKQMKRGDWLVFYSPKTHFQEEERLQCFTAVGQISDDAPYQVEMTPDFHPFRRRVHFIPGNEASIQPLLAELDFIVDKTKWGFPFRRGLFAIGENDFRRIAQAMGVNIDQFE